MNTWNPFPEGGNTKGWVHVLQIEPGGDSIALVLGSRRPTTSLSGWEFEACRLVFTGLCEYRYLPHAPRRAPCACYEREQPQTPDLHCYVVVAAGAHEVTAAACERTPLAPDERRAAAEAYARRAGASLASLSVPVRHVFANRC